MTLCYGDPMRFALEFLEIGSIKMVDSYSRTQWSEVLADNFASRGLVYELWNCHTQSSSQGNTEVRNYAQNIATVIATIAIINGVHLLWD